MKWNSMFVAFVMVIAMAGMLYAVQEAAKEATQVSGVSSPGNLADSLGLKGLVKGLLVGGLVGLAIAFLGYMKDKDVQKKWDFQQAAPTLIWGAIVGALMGMGQKDISSIEGLKDNAATVIIAELIGKAGFRTGAPVIGNVVSTLLGKKNGGGNS